VENFERGLGVADSSLNGMFDHSLRDGSPFMVSGNANNELKTNLKTVAA
jgi:hypothetical protein